MPGSFPKFTTRQKTQLKQLLAQCLEFGYISKAKYSAAMAAISEH
jgi:hypothetical protein